MTRLEKLRLDDAILKLTAASIFYVVLLVAVIIYYCVRHLTMYGMSCNAAAIQKEENQGKPRKGTYIRNSLKATELLLSLPTMYTSGLTRSTIHTTINSNYYTPLGVLASFPS